MFTFYFKEENFKKILWNYTFLGPQIRANSEHINPIGTEGVTS